MVDHLAGAVVLLAGGYLCVLGVATFVAPALAGRFLQGFAGSAQAHLLEMGLRIAVGVALIQRAPSLPNTAAFSGAGWLIALTSAALLVVPWRWHRRFAERVVPIITRHLRVFGLVSLLVGGVVLYAALGTGR